MSYKGNYARTIKQRRCQRWDTNIPNEVAYSFQDDKHHNYCRNPDNDPKGPWCYLADKKSSDVKNWQYCKRIPKCKISAEKPAVSKVPTVSKNTTKQPVIPEISKSFISESEISTSSLSKPAIPESPHYEPKCGTICKCGDRSCQPTELANKPCKIINGSLTREHEYRWQVQIRSENENPRTGFCGGSVLNKNYVLTAAHCLCDEGDSRLLHPEEKGRILVAVGFYKGYGAAEENTSTGGKDNELWKYQYGRDVIPVDENGYFVHPDYSIKKHFANDLAILKLKKSVRYAGGEKSLVKPICLPTDYYERKVYKGFF